MIDPIDLLLGLGVPGWGIWSAVAAFFLFVTGGTLLAGNMVGASVSGGMALTAGLGTVWSYRRRE